MSHGQQQKGADPVSIATGHEVTDAEPKNLVIFLVYLCATIAVTVVITWVLFVTFRDAADKSTSGDYAASPMDSQRADPQTPPIQPSAIHSATELKDRTQYFLEYNRLVNSAGTEEMADRQVHTRISVDSAIQLLADRGLPAGPPAADVPVPQGTGHSVDTPYSDAGRGTPFGIEAPPGVPQQ